MPSNAKPYVPYFKTIIVYFILPAIYKIYRLLLTMLFNSNGLRIRYDRQCRHCILYGVAAGIIQYRNISDGFFLFCFTKVVNESKYGWMRKWKIHKHIEIQSWIRYSSIVKQS